MAGGIELNRAASAASNYPSATHGTSQAITLSSHASVGECKQSPSQQGKGLKHSKRNPQLAALREANIACAIEIDEALAGDSNLQPIDFYMNGLRDT